MIKIINNLKEYPNLIRECFEKNNEENQTFYYSEGSFLEYEKRLLDNLNAGNPFYLSIDENNDIKGIGFVMYPGYEAGIKGLWGSEEAINEILEEVEKLNSKEFCVNPRKKNLKIINILKNRNYELQESSTVLIANKITNFDPNTTNYSLLQINKDNFELARPYLEKYYKDYYWNANRLYEDIDTRDVVLLMDNNVIKGVAQGVCDGKMSEIFGLDAFTDEVLHDFILLYSHHLLKNSSYLYNFLEDEHEKLIPFYLNHGFSIKYDCQYYKLKK